MTIAKGRSNNQVLIEDTIKALELMLSDIPKYFKESENQRYLEIERLAIESSDGDNEIKSSILHSLSSTLEDYDCIGFLYEALVLASYSFYERMLKKIVLSNSIELVLKNKRSKDKFYANTSIASIKRYITISTEIESMIEEMKLYYDKRNEIAHEKYDGVDKIKPSYIEEHLNKIKFILLEINSSVETKKQE